MSKELKVEMVKKGDVLFYLESKITLIEKLLLNDEESQVNAVNKDLLVEWYDGRISARLSDLETLKELRLLITKTL